MARSIKYCRGVVIIFCRSSHRCSLSASRSDVSFLFPGIGQYIPEIHKDPAGRRSWMDVNTPRPVGSSTNVRRLEPQLSLMTKSCPPTSLPLLLPFFAWRDRVL